MSSENNRQGQKHRRKNDDPASEGDQGRQQPEAGDHPSGHGRRGDPTAYLRMIDRAERFSASIDFSDFASARRALEAAKARLNQSLSPPKTGGQVKGLRLPMSGILIFPGHQRCSTALPA